MFFFHLIRACLDNAQNLLSQTSGVPITLHSVMPTWTFVSASAVPSHLRLYDLARRHSTRFTFHSQSTSHGGAAVNASEEQRKGMLRPAITSDDQQDHSFSPFLSIDVFHLKSNTSCPGRG